NMDKSETAYKNFPDDFVWGVATSAYQIEGAAAEDGKGPSIWDTFCRRPGTIADKTNGEVACDHYHRWPEDLDMIAALGVNAYRFSVSWPRVRPKGYGSWNEKGLAFYDRLVDGMLERGIQPYLTLNHWDLPDELQALGGWTKRDTAERFVEYAIGMHKRLGDRVVSIATHNEPWVVATLGYETGIFAPGIKNRHAAAQASHHLLLSHGMTLQALRQESCRAKLGIVLNMAPMYPATDADADKAKARLEDGRLVRWYMDPLFKGRYPQDVLDFLGEDAPDVRPGDLDIIRAPMDFLGINYYSRSVVSASESWDVRQSGREITDMGWEVYPEGLTELLVRVHNEYPVPPLFITENGGAFKDKPYRCRVGGHEARREDRRLYGLEPDGQLRVGIRLRQALWHYLRRLRIAGPHSQGQCPLVPGIPAKAENEDAATGGSLTHEPPRKTQTWDTYYSRAYVNTMTR
ncbi:MAG: beta-glucosidase, partial [Paucimonas sp.]|nr:beta-glucosidase [Paucimonas sp.]